MENPEIQTKENTHKQPLYSFAIQVVIYEVVLMILFGVFAKVDPNVANLHNQSFYPLFQDVNVMMLIGFGFLMVFIKNHAWSALTYTFVINALALQQYLLWSKFWHKAFTNTWSEQIYYTERDFSAASYCVASMLIAFGAVIGKVQVNNLLPLVNFGVLFYSFNEALCFQVLGVVDAGGSTTIHTFGAYFGLTMTFLISRKIKPTKSIETSKTSVTFAMIGTLFLWMFWPSFNSALISVQFQRSLIVTNTIISLSGSCLSAIVMSIFLRKDSKIDMEDVLNATLAGGVIIGAPSSVLTNIGGALAIGFIGGAVSSLCFAKLTPKLKQCMNLDDSCGVQSLHGIPGILGGILSGIVIAGYHSAPMDETIRPFLSFYYTNDGAIDLSRQAGIQIAATFVSQAIGIVAGLVAGAILYCSVTLENGQLYDDSFIFAVPEEEQNKLKPSTEQKYLEESKTVLKPKEINFD